MADEKLWELESVRKQVELAGQWAGMIVRDEMLNELRSIVEVTDSPIEAMFAVWWTAMTRATPKLTNRFELFPQFGLAPINGRSYYVDFAIWPKDVSEMSEGVPCRGVMVELDGHDFHEKTKEQVAYRNQRDRDLQEAGHIVLHFSGSEIYRNGAEVVTSSVLAALKEYMAFKAAADRKRLASEADK